MCLLLVVMYYKIVWYYVFGIYSEMDCFMCFFLVNCCFFVVFLCLVCIFVFHLNKLSECSLCFYLSLVFCCLFYINICFFVVVFFLVCIFVFFVVFRLILFELFLDFGGFIYFWFLFKISWLLLM